jgi:hypothetical protein
MREVWESIVELLIEVKTPVSNLMGLTLGLPSPMSIIAGSVSSS